jgi:hypothetical protein
MSAIDSQSRLNGAEREGCRVRSDSLVDRVAAALESGSPVNVVGVLGVGKSRGVAALPGAHVVDVADTAVLADLGARFAATTGLLVVDSVDGAVRARAVRAALPADRPVVLVSRRPLTVTTSWRDSVLGTVEVEPWTDAEISALVAGLTQDERRTVVRLACGVPAIAAAAGQAIAAGVASSLGAVADFVAVDLAGRIGRELRGRQEHVLRLLAAVGAADERILGAPNLFAQVSQLSLVDRAPAGLVLREPFRTVIDFAYAWRNPQRRCEVRERVSRYRVEQLAHAADPDTRGALAEQALLLTKNTEVQQTIFVPEQGRSIIRGATEADGNSIAKLMRGWADRGGFSVATCDWLAESWINDDVSSFHVTQDPDGALTGLARLAPITAATAGGMELLLQQHAEPLAGKQEGYFLSAAFCPDRVAHAQLLRWILRTSIPREHLVVSTATADYQHLLQVLRFVDHGSIRDDVLSCGRPPGVYSMRFTPGDLPAWIRRLDNPADGITTDSVAQALAKVDDLTALAGCRLAGCCPGQSVEALAERLRDGVRMLLDGPDLVDAEAGRILAGYYFGRHRSHQWVARDLHLSRATYFRRLRHGLDRIAAGFRAPAPAAVGGGEPARVLSG